MRCFAKAIGQRAKTDPIDAGVIAHFAEATKPQVRPLPDADAQLLADIDGANRGSPAWRENEDLLSSVPGIGPGIARTLIAEMPELGRLDRKEIAALAGLAWTSPILVESRLLLPDGGMERLLEGCGAGVAQA